MSPWHIALATIASFVAGIIDAMAGGGGVFTMPSIASFGLPIPQVAGTNKLVGVCGSSSATFRFLRSGKIVRHVAVVGGALTLVGACAGALAVAHLGRGHEPALRTVFGTLLVLVALYMAFRPSFGRENRYAGPNGRNLAILSATGLLVGFYDGFFGPGTGSLLAFAMVRLLRFDFVVGTGNAKALNFTSNVAAVGTFLWKGLVVWPIAIPMGVANAAGSRLGASLAIARGPGLLRPVFLLMACVVAARLLFA